MATYAQLQAEPWWGREIDPPALRDLYVALRERYGLTAVEIGGKGDSNHLRGYHRSAEWIARSAYCVNRSYSVTETPGNRAPGDPRWICGMDITVPRAVLLPMCRRLDAAVRAGRLEKVVEWYGNTDGDQRVDGYDNIRNRIASSDSSHLWHLHVSLDRGRADEDHADLYTILTGDDMALTPADASALFGADVIPAPEGVEEHPDTNPTWAFTSWLRYVLLPILMLVKGIDTKLDALITAHAPVDLPPGEVGETALSDADVDRIATRTAELLAARLAN